MCEICSQDKCPATCPNYSTPKVSHYCSICNEGIYGGEEYVESDIGEFAHYDCLLAETYKDIFTWLGHGVRTMDEFNELEE